jgi:hypothetical protein
LWNTCAWLLKSLYFIFSRFYTFDWFDWYRDSPQNQHILLIWYRKSLVKCHTFSSFLCPNVPSSSLKARFAIVSVKSITLVSMNCNFVFCNFTVFFANRPFMLDVTQY